MGYWGRWGRNPITGLGVSGLCLFVPQNLIYFHDSIVLPHNVFLCFRTTTRVLIVDLSQFPT